MDYPAQNGSALALDKPYAPRGEDIAQAVAKRSQHAGGGTALPLSTGAVAVGTHDLLETTARLLQEAHQVATMLEQRLVTVTVPDEPCGAEDAKRMEPFTVNDKLQFVTASLASLSARLQRLHNRITL